MAERIAPGSLDPPEARRAERAGLASPLHKNREVIISSVVLYARSPAKPSTSKKPFYEWETDFWAFTEPFNVSQNNIHLNSKKTVFDLSYVNDS